MSQGNQNNGISYFHTQREIFYYHQNIGILENVQDRYKVFCLFWFLRIIFVHTCANNYTRNSIRKENIHIFDILFLLYSYDFYNNRSTAVACDFIPINEILIHANSSQQLFSRNKGLDNLCASFDARSTEKGFILVVSSDFFIVILENRE